MPTNWISNDTKNMLNQMFSTASLGNRILYRLDVHNLRHAYYLITPNETMFESIDQVPNYNVQMSVWWLCFILFEFCFLTLRGYGSRFALNDSLTSISAGMLSQCFKFGGKTIAIFLYVYIWNNFRIIDNSWDSTWTWILCLFFQDFMYYLGHRAIHEAGFFWGLHTIHHSSEYYNFTTALRQAAIQDTGLAIYDVLQAFCIPPPMFLVHRYFSEIYQFTLHTSLFDNYGPLGIFLNTPSHHRVHHGRNPYCIDRNYGGVFIIWDKLFHTFEPERSNEKPVYGLIVREKNFNQLYLQFHALYDLLFVKWRMKTDKGLPVFRGIEKLKAIYYPPIYMPGMKVRWYFHWLSMVDHEEGVPQIEKDVIRYDPIIPKWQKAYCFGHFLLLLAAFLHFEFDRSRMSYTEFTINLIFFVSTMQCLGAFFDCKSHASYMEILRCTGMMAYYFHMITESSNVQLNKGFMIVIYASSAIFWSTYIVSRVSLYECALFKTDCNVFRNNSPILIEFLYYPIAN